MNVNKQAVKGMLSRIDTLESQVRSYELVLEHIQGMVKETPDEVVTYNLPISELVLIDIKRVCKKALPSSPLLPVSN